MLPPKANPIIEFVHNPNVATLGLIIRERAKVSRTAVLFIAEARLILTIGHVHVYSQFPGICFEFIHQPFERLSIFIRIS